MVYTHIIIYIYVPCHPIGPAPSVQAGALVDQQCQLQQRLAQLQRDGALPKEPQAQRGTGAVQQPLPPMEKWECFIELDDGKIYRKPLYLMVKTMVSCRFSLKPIHWVLGNFKDKNMKNHVEHEIFRVDFGVDQLVDLSLLNCCLANANNWGKS